MRKSIILLVVLLNGFVQLAHADGCVKKLDGRWEIVADDEHTKNLIKITGNQIIAFDTEKMTIAARIGENDKAPKSIVLESCDDHEIVFESEKEKGGRLKLRLTFTAPDRFTMQPAEAKEGTPPPQVFKRLP